jgi:hypothetical protein
MANPPSYYRPSTPKREAAPIPTQPTGWGKGQAATQGPVAPIAPGHPNYQKWPGEYVAPKKRGKKGAPTPPQYYSGELTPVPDPVGIVDNIKKFLGLGKYDEAQKLASTPTHGTRKLEPVDDPEWFFYKRAQDVNPKDYDQADKIVGLNNQLASAAERAKWLGTDPDELPKRPDVMHFGFWEMLEQLRRPQYATNAMVYHMLKGEFDPFSLALAIKRGFLLDEKVEGVDIMHEAYGQDKAGGTGILSTFAQALPEGPRHKMGHIAGFAWDLIMDPLNFVGVGEARDVLKGGEAGLKGLGILKAGRYVAKAGDVVRDASGAVVAVKGATKAFRVGAHVAGAGEEIYTLDKAIPYVRAAADAAHEAGLAGPEVAAFVNKYKTSTMRQGASFFTGFLPSLVAPVRFTGKELDAVKKFGVTVDQLGRVTPGATMIALESKHGKRIMEAFAQGRLEDFVKGQTLLERIEKGQWSFVKLFGHSLMTRDMNASLFKAGAALSRPAGRGMLKIPGVKPFVGAMAKMKQTGAAFFTTSSGKFITNPDVVKSFDAVEKAGRNIQQMQADAALRRLTELFRAGQKAGFKPEHYREFWHAFELPQLDQTRDILLMDQGFRQEFVRSLKGVAPDVDFSQMETMFSKPEITPQELGATWDWLKQNVHDGVIPQDGWKVHWDNFLDKYNKAHDSKLGPWGGQIFGAKGVPLDDVIKRMEDFIGTIGDPIRQAFTRHAMKEFRSILDNVWEKENQYGLIHTYLKGYMPHTVDPASMDFLQGLPEVVGRKAKSLKPYKQREDFLMLKDITDEMSREMGGGEVLAHHFTENPYLAVAIRAAGIEPRNVAGAFVHKTMAEKFGHSPLTMGFNKVLEVFQGTGKQEMTRNEILKGIGLPQIKMTEHGVYTSTGPMAISMKKLDQIKTLVAKGDFESAAKDLGVPVNDISKSFADADVNTPFLDVILPILPRNGEDVIKLSDLREAYARGDDLKYILSSALGHTGHSMLNRGMVNQIESTGNRMLRGIGEQTTKGLMKDDIYFPDDVAQAMESMLEKANDPGKVAKELRKVWDPLQNLWKGWTLSVNPAFHFRNGISNTINMWLSGMKPSEILDGAILENKFQRVAHAQLKETGHMNVKQWVDPWLDKQMIAANGTAYTNRQLMEMHLSHGVWGSGIFSMESPETIMESISGRPDIVSWAGVNPLSHRNHAMRSGLWAGRTIENNARGSLFLHGILSKGNVPEESAANVAKWLFDYDDLTKDERWVKRWMIPFYTWTRKNLSLQFHNMIDVGESGLPLTARSGVASGATSVSIWDKIRKDIADDRGLDYYALREFIAKSVPIKLWNDEKTGQPNYFVLKNYIPVADLAEIFEPMQNAIEQANPVWKMGVEGVLNYSTFYHAPIEKFPGAKREFLGVEWPAQWQKTLSVVGVLNTLDKLNPGGVFDKTHQALYGEPTPPTKYGEPGQGYRVARALTGLRTYQDDPNAIIMNREYEWLDNINKWLSYRAKNIEKFATTPGPQQQMFKQKIDIFKELKYQREHEKKVDKEKRKTAQENLNRTVFENVETGAQAGAHSTVNPKKKRR